MNQENRMPIADLSYEKYLLMNLQKKVCIDDIFVIILPFFLC